MSKRLDKIEEALIKLAQCIDVVERQGQDPTTYSMWRSREELIKEILDI